MIRIMIHIPVNVRSWLVNYIMDRQNQLEEAAGDKIAIYTPHDEEYASDICDQWLPQAIEKDIVPDIALSMVVEYASIPTETLGKSFGKVADFIEEKNSVRKEFNSLVDSDDIFYPFSITPLTMLYNTQTVNETDLKHSWEDLFNPKFRIVFPDREKPLCKAVGAYIKERYPEKFEDFEKKVCYTGSPASMAKSLATGEFDLSMTLAPFAEISRNEIIEVNKPLEGNILMPQVISCKKGSEKKIRPIFKLLTSADVQEYLENQGVWTMRPNGNIDADLTKNNQLSNWKGWNAYLSNVLSFDKYNNQ